MKNILVPTDFSTEAEYALKVAAQLAKKHNARIILLHLVELPITSATDAINLLNTYENFPESVFFMKIAHKRFEEVREREYLQDIEIKEIIETENVFNGIKEACIENDIDLIIMGSKGTSGLAEMFVGSNTEKVVRHADVPVLVIKNNHDNFNINTIVFATNLEDKAVESFNKVNSFAQLFNAKIALVYINTANYFSTTQEIENKHASFMEKLSVNKENVSFSIYSDHKVEWGILHYAQKIKADVIAVATHGRKGLAHFFNGSISEDLTNHANKPVITFKL